MANNDGKKLNVYTIDSWNQMNIHQHGRRYVVSEINSFEGEFTHDFASQYEMIRWAEHRFSDKNTEFTPEQREEILAKFRRA
ncbi:hypothetical protein OS242_07925 [Tumebacillus sp. DT12]|uniref:Uncharacterized protein n=1 Tax=Tumebacillus lacus TaxID=2995335 RepID=A0ABT3X2U7_9BACL|nr:hypothetical protein [Tumebacillus lacus]MCX7569890.1 hypothetical protein [Tumebacillus lacus]